MEIVDKKINFLGDSITEGVGASTIENDYVNVFARISGAEVRNYGISGTRIARQIGIPEEEWERVNRNFFTNRVDEMDADADIVVVFGGTNDFGHGDAPLGSMTDRTDCTFYGALHVLCNQLLNRYPNALIVFMTPLHRLGENDALNNAAVRAVAPLSRYVEIIKEVAQYYSLPVLDLYSMSGIQPNVEIIRQKYMPDGLHPCDEGMEKIAKLLYAFLKNNF